MQVVAVFESKVPVALHHDPHTLSTPDGELMATSPFDWDIWEVWEWLR